MLNESGRRNASHDRLLQEFKARASGQKQQIVAQWDIVLKESLAEKRVEGIMPSDVFSDRVQPAVRNEERGGMQATGLPEGCLRRLKLLRKRRKDIRLDRKVILLRRWTKCPESEQRCLAADATT